MKVGLLTYYLRQKDYPTRYSLAALRLGEYLNSSGVDVDLLPISLIDFDLKEVVENQIKGKFDIVGISHYVWAKKATPAIAEGIRKYAPEVSVIIGGPEVENIDLNEFEDEIFILGEGEEGLVKSVRYIEEGKSNPNFFKENINIFNKANPEREKAEEMLLYKSPLFTKFKDIDKDFLYYETSRGCAYNCAYCGFRNRDHVELFDMDFVEEEIKRIGKIGFKEVFVVDANLGGTPSRAKQVLKLFNKYAPEAKLTIYLRPEFIDDETVELLSKANLKDVRIGVQTLNEKVPSWIRSNSMKSVTEELPKLSAAGIPWKSEFIIGLPGDDMEGLKKSLDFAEEKLKPLEICCYPLTVIKGTPLYEKTIELKGENDGLWLKADGKGRAYESSSYTEEELIKMQEYATKRMNDYLLRQSKMDDSIKEQKIERNAESIYRDEK